MYAPRLDPCSSVGAPNLIHGRVLNLLVVGSRSKAQARSKNDSDNKDLVAGAVKSKLVYVNFRDKRD